MKIGVYSITTRYFVNNHHWYGNWVVDGENWFKVVENGLRWLKLI